VIDPHYLENDFDTQVLVEAVKYARTIVAQPPLSSAIVAQYFPPATSQTDAQIETFVRESVSPLFHPIGTASMGPETVAGAAWGGVVNSDLKVYGTTNLRVVDASVIPLLIAAHTQEAVYGIAETAAGLIKTEYA